ncbi:lantibiotic dehydratase family protein [Chryseobacterium soli]|uniref:lantibiotic dehydratase n=1 Tax=Chryseobacterium soli TaxID=445961 RepID=UPI002954DDF2|nr:lantibiotic dehydratase [Chryseobacterium soli]MDV7697833.1 lantibiotic dehydratase family protein [Chryseobacterium soli]
MEKFGKEEISNDELKEICTHPVFLEAIYLASPYLYEEVIQWLLGKDMPLKQFQKLKNTILKYYSRMSTRCTPFGLFAGVGLGKFSLETSNIFTNKIFNYQLSTDNMVRDTKLDMHFLVSLAQHFVQLPEIRNKLFVFP